ncbi:hypothetical protein HA039_30430 [Streptomyces liangshanensis]|uniref:DUF1579 domain-containing protein n=2 Tax=Streptomyces liangshanensis TaxID=2717324 RepID=A0A6G9HAL9_9ACTN|nr:hypothetical protein HA039_30430 [Streptomyces liangshanensis]
MDELSFFLGSWDAPGKFHHTPFAPEKPIHMDIVGSGELDPHFLRISTAERPTPENRNPLRATYLWGYDTASDEFVADWFDSNGGRARQRSTGWSGDTLVFEGTITMAGATVPLRDTFTRHDQDSYHHIGEIDLGQGWIPVDEEDVRRVSPSAA